MYRRILDGLIALWLLGGCVLLTAWRELGAAPAPVVCDKDCRNITYAGYVNAAGKAICYKYSVDLECLVCTIGGGCDNSVAKSGNCTEDPTVPQKIGTVTGTIVCPNPVAYDLYQAKSTGTPTSYTPANRNWYTCK